MIHVTKAERGFTLVEIMVAVVILGMTLTLLLGLRNRDIELVGYARAMTTATLLAHAKLVELSVQDRPLVGEQGGDFSIGPQESLGLYGGIGYLSEFRWIRRVIPTASDSIREVRVRVSWTRGLDEEFVELTSYVFVGPKRKS
ncbi:MAG: hypothetical protein OJF52_001943 [Nitrospira sp.]|nr:MAG: hypothetical protein OJF52_001943 [Nitrospira sp.]